MKLHLLTSIVSLSCLVHCSSNSPSLFALIIFKYILQSALRYSIPAKTFEARYEPNDIADDVDPATAPVPSEELRAEGFLRFKPRAGAARIWALRMSAATVAEHFPAGCFVASWGEQMVVQARDWLALTHPVTNMALHSLQLIRQALVFEFIFVLLLR